MEAPGTGTGGDGSSVSPTRDEIRPPRASDCTLTLSFRFVCEEKVFVL